MADKKVTSVDNIEDGKLLGKTRTITDPTTGESKVEYQGNFGQFADPTKAPNTSSTGEVITGTGIADAGNIAGFRPDGTPIYQTPVVDSTDNLTDANNLANQDANNAIGDAESGTETPDAALARLTEEQGNLGTFTTDELSAIDEAGEAARLAFQPIVEETEERRRVTLPGDVVRAGEKGGFLSTQQAGVAALLPTDKREGEAFVGAGGALDQKRQTLDRAVALAKTKQQEAIAQAKAAQRKATMTQKRADFDVAINLAQLAQKFDQDAQSLALQKSRLGLDIVQEERTAAEQERRFEFDIAKFDIGEERLQRSQNLDIAKFERDITEDTQSDTLDNISRMANSRIPLDEFSDKKIRELEVKAGLEAGTFESFYSSLEEGVQRGDILNELDLQQKVATLNRTKKLAAGGSGITSTGDTIKPTVEGDPMNFDEWLQATGEQQKMTMSPNETNRQEYNKYFKQFQQLNNNYYNEIANKKSPTATETKDIRRLEAVGLKDAPRDEQLNYLYGAELEEPTKAENEGSVWEWLSTSDAQDLTTEEKKQQIMEMGLSPQTFNIY